MLKYRILTAVMLIPLVIGAIFFLPPLSFFSVAMLLILLAGWEWSRLIGMTHFAKRLIYLIILSFLLVFFVFIPIYYVIVMGIIWWLIAISLLLIYPRASRCFTENFPVRAVIGFLVLIPCWIGLIILQGFSPALLLYCLILIWGADSAAYFVGKRLGRHKLAPSISPGKTREGLLAGCLISIVIAGVGLWILDIPAGKKLLFFIFSVIGGGGITVIGDLFESMVKRQCQVKDSGTILPGHGGLLDRIDSLTTAIPFFALFFPLLLGS